MKKVSEFSKYLDLAVKYSNEGNAKEAIGYLEKIVKIKPNFSTGWVMMGQEYEKLQEWEEARNCYDEALKVDSKNSDAEWSKRNLQQRYTGMLYDDKLKEKEKTEESFQKAVIKASYNRSINMQNKKMEKNFVDDKGVRCVRCGKTENIKQFFHHTRDIVKVKQYGSRKHGGYKITTTYQGSGGSGYFPACSSCIKIFYTYRTIRHITYGIISIAALILLIVILSWLIPGLMGVPGVPVNPLADPEVSRNLINACILVAIPTIFTKSLKYSKYSPSRVMRTRYRKPEISPKNYNIWMPIKQWTSGYVNIEEFMSPGIYFLRCPACKSLTGKDKIRELKGICPRCHYQIYEKIVR